MSMENKVMDNYLLKEIMLSMTFSWENSIIDIFSEENIVIDKDFYRK